MRETEGIGGIASALDLACKICGGSGRVRSRNSKNRSGWRQCVACNGTGGDPYYFGRPEKRSRMKDKKSKGD
jgi:DnaJ-class molecular chaperone